MSKIYKLKKVHSYFQMFLTKKKLLEKSNRLMMCNNLVRNYSCKFENDMNMR